MSIRTIASTFATTIARFARDAQPAPPPNAVPRTLTRARELVSAVHRVATASVQNARALLDDTIRFTTYALGYERTATTNSPARPAQPYTRPACAAAVKPETAPVIHAPTPVIHELAPVKHEPASVIHELAPVIRTPTPMIHEKAPVKHEPTPVIPELTPVIPEPTPVIPELTPVIPELTPVIPEPTPVIPEPTPVIPEPTPVIPEATPMVPEATPMVPEATPMVPEATPMVPEATPAMPDAARARPRPGHAQTATSQSGGSGASARPPTTTEPIATSPAPPTTTPPRGASNMSELIEAIRAAVAQGATADQKAIGAQACRTILTALDAEPGKPLVLPGAPKPHPLSGITLNQALDLAIARLTMVANARETTTEPTATTPPAPATAPQIPPQPERQGPQIPLVRPSSAKGPTANAAPRPVTAPRIPLAGMPPRSARPVPKKQ